MTLSRRRLFAIAGATTLAVAGTTSSSLPAEATSTAAGVAFLAADQLHAVEITLDEADFQQAVDAYLASTKKEWIEATVTIDGQTYSRVGMRLKGNSSLKSLTTESTPESLPWLIRFDKYVSGQTCAGTERLVVRSNTSTTALNEAVALDLLAQAGLASSKCAHIALSVNGSTPQVRLVCQDLDEQWAAQNFSGSGLLYKAEAGGDYSYRGTEASAYEEIFDQETGQANLTPLIEFLRFINEASDEEFQAELSTHVDVAKLTAYLAFEDVIDNFDDITGPGNNSFLWWETETAQMTVVAWDHNCAFGLKPGGGGRGGAAPSPPRGQAGAKSNPLVTRFNELLDGESLVATERTRLTETLYASGQAQAILDSRRAVLESQAAELVDAATIDSEARAIAAYFG